MCLYVLGKVRYMFLAKQTIGIIIVKCLSRYAKKMEIPGPLCKLGPD